MALSFARHLATLISVVLAGQVAAAPAPKAVVELFTSQGCSSCPPADEFLRELAGREDILALTFPVDYWDYLGWKDTLAQAAFTSRQRAYASARGDKQVYTPQVVVNGTSPCIGSDRSEIEAVMAQPAGKDPMLPVAISINERGAAVTVEVGLGSRAHHAGVWLLPVAKAREVAIGRGENKGRTVTYANVVRGMVKLGEWTGQPERYEFPVDAARAGDAETYVVLLQAAAQDSRLGPILGAAKGPGF
jgi:hypothetical protein